MNALRIMKESKVNLHQRLTQKSLITTRNVAVKILTIMAKHIGRNNAVSREELFYKLYGQNFKDDMGDYIRWDFAKKAMSYIRKHSKAYIVFDKRGTSYYYFVAKSHGDETFYVDFLNKTIKKLQGAKVRVVKAINEGWYKQSWGLDTRERKQIK